MICSKNLHEYFISLIMNAEKCYEIATDARKKKSDPELEPEIYFAEDLASRVESLVGPKGISKKIRELGKELDREELAIRISQEVAHGEFKKIEDALEQSIRTGLAVFTEGVPVAPLEGIAGVKIKRNPNGSHYPAIYFAGPIRSAGGTAQVLSVLIADIVRRDLGLSRYIPTKEEIERYKEEIILYNQHQHLQYMPTNEEIELITKNCPVCIDGEGTEDAEVVGYRNLQRVETNRLRAGACLVIAEGLCLKAPKVLKHVKKLKIDSWEFVEKLVNIFRSAKQEDESLLPESKYMKDLIGGRPVFSHPSRKGGFRLRYGRCRNSGLAAVGIAPATMIVLDDFLAVGTQLKLERPGKAGIVVPCDTLEGPIVILKNGELAQINNIADAKKIKPEIKEIVDIGEILISQGEFAENNHVLLPSGYCMEWWLQELEHAVKDISKGYLDPDAETAFMLSERYSIPICPKYNLFWGDMKSEEILKLRNTILESGFYHDNCSELAIPKTEELKEILVGLGALHKERDGKLVFDRTYSYLLLRYLGLTIENGKIISKTDDIRINEGESTIDFVSRLAHITIRERAPTRIGARMGRPEKSKERKLKPPVHVLFPLGMAGGTRRLVKAAAEGAEENTSELPSAIPRIPTRLAHGYTDGIEMGLRVCASCGKRTFLVKCSSCSEHTKQTENVCMQKLDIKELLEKACKNLNETEIPNIKGVKGLISKYKTPEALEKGFLRAKHNVFVFKDGTIRYDMTNAPLTHFTPAEVNVSIEKLKTIGYEYDCIGNKLESETQILELKPQDIIVSKGCLEYMLRVAKFIDELLVKFYGLKSVYNAKEINDLIGQLVVGLSPHTAAGVLARIIGWTNASACYAHPFYHAAKRRNCDGDEDAVILLLDALLNFSRSYLPGSRGGLEDAPLVLTTRIDPDEIDKEARNFDLTEKYGLEFYEATLRNAHPKDIEHVIDSVDSRIGTELQYEKFKFTHEASNIAHGVIFSAYKTLETMRDKIDAQLALATKIRAVDASDVASKVISTHFLPDLIGNLNQFSKQKFRCTKCNTVYRRIPLAGKCTKCSGNLTLTVHEGGVRKYLAVTKEIAEKYKISDYTIQRISLIENAINSLFQNDKVQKAKLEDFL